MKNKIFRYTMLSFCLIAVLAGGAYAQGSEYTAVYTQTNQVGPAEVAPNGGVLMASGDFRFEMVSGDNAADFYLYSSDYSRVASQTDLLGSVVIFYKDNSEELVDVYQKDGKFSVTADVNKEVVFYTITVLVGEEHIGARYIVGEE
ncbi:MAG: hypothetical protein HKN22_03090 [Bacteroidia bacterium]|nr:hypothetical protein [Bacteroidia bacterium]